MAKEEMTLNAKGEVGWVGMFSYGKDQNFDPRSYSVLIGHHVLWKIDEQEKCNRGYTPGIEDRFCLNEYLLL